MKSILFVMLVGSSGLQAVEIYGKIVNHMYENGREYCLVSGKATFQIHVNSSMEFKSTLPDFGAYEVWATKQVVAGFDGRGGPPIYKKVFAKFSDIRISAQFDNKIDALAHACFYKIVDSPIDMNGKFIFTFHGESFPKEFGGSARIESDNTMIYDLFDLEPLDPTLWKSVNIDEFRGPRAFEAPVETPVPGKHFELEFRKLKPVEKLKSQSR